MGIRYGSISRLRPFSGGARVPVPSIADGLRAGDLFGLRFRTQRDHSSRGLVIQSCKVLFGDLDDGRFAADGDMLRALLTGFFD
jgi:hypothetical protein